MKKILILIAVLAFTACAKSPEKVIEKYSDGLKEGKFDSTLWDLNAFSRLYYSAYWDKAEEADRKKLISIIETTSNNFALMNKIIAGNAHIKSYKTIEANEKTAKISALFVRNNDEKISLEITFMLTKESGSWKILNIDKLATGTGLNFDPLAIFKQNLPLLLKDAGYPIDNINLKLINQFYQEKFLKKVK